MQAYSTKNYEDSRNVILRIYCMKSGSQLMSQPKIVAAMAPSWPSHFKRSRPCWQAIVSTAYITAKSCHLKPDVRRF